jgi:hypothetical protein
MCAHTRFSTDGGGNSDGGVGWSICSEHEVLWEMGGGPVLHVDSGLARIVKCADAVRQEDR